MPSLDAREYRYIFAPYESINPNDYFIVHYRIVPLSGTSIKEVAARLAMLTSLGTMNKLPYESASVRIDMSAKVLAAKNDGEVVIAYPLELCGENEGFTQLLTMVFYGASFNYTSELWVDGIHFPQKFINRYKGPRFSTRGIRELYGIYDRPLIGIIMKPRLGVSLEIIAKQCYEGLLGGADFIVDDELFLDRDNELGFNNRISRLMKVVRRAEAETGEKKWYVTNIGASPLRALKYAQIANEEGASGLLVNAFTMGFSTVEEIISELNGLMPITVHNMGVGILTRPIVSEDLRRPTGVSDALIAKLSRIIGGDAVHAGISNSEWYHEEAWGDPIVALRTKLYDIQPSFAVAAGGLNVANIWDNIASLGQDVIFEAGTGLLGFPTGVRQGAKAFRKMVDNLHYKMSSEEAHETIASLADKDKILRNALVYYGYQGNKK